MEMMNVQRDAAAAQYDERYRALLAVAQTITLHRDLAALFHELSDRLHDVAQFDCLAAVLYDAANNTVRIHILEPAEPDLSAGPGNQLPADQTPAGWVLDTQKALIVSSAAEYTRWPAIVKNVQEYGLRSGCELPLTTARRKLGTLIFACKQPAAFQEADVHFLQLVANQVAVAVENALAFQEIEALKDKLAKEKAYLEDEVRAEHDFGDIVGESKTLRNVLKKVETVAPTDSTAVLRQNSVWPVFSTTSSSCSPLVAVM